MKSSWNKSWPITLAIMLGMVALVIMLVGMASPPATQAASLSLNGSSKNVEPPLIQPGHLVTYTIVLSNDASTPITATVVDYSPPGMTYITGTLPGTLWGISTDVLTWTGRLNAYQVVTITFRGQADSGLSDGTHITNTAAISDGLNQLERSATVVIDTQAPSLMFESPQLGEVITSATVTASGLAWDAGQSPFPPSPVLNPINNNGGGYYFVTWSATEAGALYLLEEDTSLTFPDPSIPYSGTDTTTPLLVRGAGTYYYRVKAITTQGASPWSNVVSATVTTLDAAYDTRLLASTQLTSTLSSVWVQIDSSPWFQASGTLHWTYQFPLPTSDYAAHTLRAYARDIAGNTSPTATLTFFADRLAPSTTITNLAQNQEIGGQYIIRGTTGSDGSGIAQVIIEIDDGATTLRPTATGTTTWSYTWSPVGVQKPYTITAYAIDGVGNVGDRSTSYSVIAGYSKLYLPLIYKRYPPVPGKPVITISNPEYDGDYTVTWTAADLAATYELQEDDNGSFTSPQNIAFSPSSGTQAGITGRICSAAVVSCAYYYRVRGHNTLPSGGYGPWSDPVAATIYNIPSAPVLNAISNDDQDGTYNVTWSASTAAERYVLQEANNSSFSPLLAEYDTGLALTQSFTNKADGTYYYRVRAVNPRASAESNVVSTVVEAGYYDDFTDSSTGWSIRRSDDAIDKSSDFKTKYLDGYLYTLLKGRYDFSVTSPMVKAPAPPYTIKTVVKVVDDTIDGIDYWPKDGETYGIVFGGNSGTPCPADRDTPKGTGCMSHYYRLLVVWSASTPTSFGWSLKRIDYHDPDNDGKGTGDKLLEGNAGVSNINNAHEWKIKVTSSKISVYLNDDLLGEAEDTKYINDPYFGLFAASPQYGGVGYRWSWFKIE